MSSLIVNPLSPLAVYGASEKTGQVNFAIVLNSLRMASFPDGFVYFGVGGTMTSSDGLSNPCYMPLRVSAEGIKHLSSLTQFHPIADNVLIRLAERRTRLNVPDRWVAIALILGNRIPIPVPLAHGRLQPKPSEATTPPKLVLIAGGRIPR